MRTEPLKKAQDKYLKKMKGYAFRLHTEDDKDIIKYLDSVPNKTDLIRTLLKEHMKR